MVINDPSTFYAVVLTTNHLPDRIWKADDNVSLWSGLTAKLNNTQTILKDQGLRASLEILQGNINADTDMLNISI